VATVTDTRITALEAQETRLLAILDSYSAAGTQAYRSLDFQVQKIDFATAQRELSAVQSRLSMLRALKASGGVSYAMR